MTTTSLLNAFQYKAWADQEILDYGRQQLAQLPLNDATYFIRILNHIAIVDAIFIARLTGNPVTYTEDNTSETPSIHALQSFMLANDHQLYNLVSSYADEDLSRQLEFTFLDGQNAKMRIEEVLIHLLMHGSNHRGMAAHTLMVNNLDRPKDTFTRFLHESEPYRREIL